MDGNQIISSARQKMEKSFSVMKEDFGTVKTGKAAPQLVENVIISAYQGTARLKIMELATIHAQDTQTLVLTPFDQSVIRDIEKGLSDSQMGLGIAVDGSIIRITIPPLTQERRGEFVRLVARKAENGKIMIRQMRQDAKDNIKKLKDEGHISEDEVERLEKEVQRMTDEYMDKIETSKDEKEKELMSL